MLLYPIMAKCKEHPLHQYKNKENDTCGFMLLWVISVSRLQRFILVQKQKTQLTL